jgi:hypothetical protein
VTVPEDEDGRKAITAKARILKGTAPKGTTIDTELRIDAFDGEVLIASNTVPGIQLGVGKGGTGRKLTMNITQCDSGSIDFVATFSGRDGNGALCESSDTINKTCKLP